MKAWWQQSVDEVCAYFQTDPIKGLSSLQANKRLRTYGPNVLPTQKSFSVITLFLEQFNNYMMWILIAAICISGISGLYVDAITIAIIVLGNALLGFFQEYKAEQMLTALRHLLKPVSHVMRDGVVKKISSEQLVPGDCVILESGDTIPADARVVKSYELATSEAAMTGESVAVVKTADALDEKELMIGDRINMVFMGSTVVSGKGLAIITQTAGQTELGKIAYTLEILPEEETPLEKDMKRLGYWLLAACLIVIILILVTGILKGESLITLALIAISIAVAAIPEGLPAVISISLARALTRMAKRNAYIRRLAAVESLASITTICVDKTGTLTQNEMAVSYIWVSHELYTVTGTGYVPEGTIETNQGIINPSTHHQLMQLLQISVLCNNAHLVKKNGTWSIIGDPTEAALLTAAGKVGLHKEILEKEFPLIYELPFDSKRKRMSMLRKGATKEVLFVKGAPDSILAICTSIALSNNTQEMLTQEKKQQLERIYADLARQGLRVLACAYRELQKGYEGELETNLIFVGFIAMHDPIRSEVPQALEKCKRAGIRTIMITGDYKDTALAIANQLGLIQEKSLIISGVELDRMTDKQLKDSIDSTVVYARVTPDHKLRIVNALRSQGKVVAMTGDGVNDALALKAADVGIAMGSGTDIAKESADMVIADNNFVSIVQAIEEGRGAYDNMLKFTRYLISSNIAELIVIAAGSVLSLLGFKSILIFSSLQILWLNLISDGPPALALAFDSYDPYIMHRKPRLLEHSFITRKHIVELFLISLIIAAGALLAGYIGLSFSPMHGSTMALTTLIMLEFVRLYLVRSPSSHFFSNPWLIIACALSLGLQLLILGVPFLRAIFKVVSLNTSQWLIILAISCFVWALGVVLRKTIFLERR